MSRGLPEKSTPIINDIIEKLAASKLSVYEFKIVMAVIRKTYGWSKKSDWISGSQLEEMTGIMRHNCHRTVSALVRKKILIKSGVNIGMNKRVSEWQVEDQRGKKVSHEIVPTEILVSQEIVPQEILASTSGDTQLVPQEIHTKDTITKDTITKESVAGPKRPSDDALILGEGLLKCILYNNEKFRHDKKTVGRWAEEIDRMIRIDKRTFDEVKAMIRYAQADSFWRTNILSAKKLREKFDTLWMHSKRPAGNQKTKKIFFTTKPTKP